MLKHKRSAWSDGRLGAAGARKGVKLGAQGAKLDVKNVANRTAKVRTLLPSWLPVTVIHRGSNSACAVLKLMFAR
jgi:hypothetical protein